PGAAEEHHGVDPFGVRSDAVGELAAAPRVDVVDRALRLRDVRLDELLNLGELLVGRLGRDDVDELVLLECRCHVSPSGLAATRSALRPAPVVARSWCHAPLLAR